VTIITFYGNIATGKTTLSRSLMQAFPDLVYLSDDVLYSMFGMGTYRFGASPEAFVFNAMRQLLVGAVAMNGLNVLIDIPAHTHDRRRLFEIRGCNHVSINTGWHHDPAYHAEARFNHDSRGTSLETWNMVATRLNDEREDPSPLWSRIPSTVVETRLAFKSMSLEEVLEP